MLELLKKLLGAGADADIAQFCLDDATQLALDYCNIAEIPQSMETLIVRMAVDLYRLGGYGSTESPQGPITSIKEGEQSVTYATLGFAQDRGAMAADNGAAILANYQLRLNEYRKLR